MESDDRGGVVQIQAATGQSSASAKFVESLRELVREELQRPVSKPEQAPTWRDAVWLLVCIANVALLFSWIPESWVEDKRLEFLSKFLPYLCSGLFFVGYTWFRERLLDLSRQRRSQVLQGILLVALVFLQFPLFSVEPIVGPKGAKLLINGKDADYGPGQKIRRALGNYQIKVIRGEHDKPNERSFRLSWKQLAQATVGNRQPQWVLAYPVVFVSPETPGIVVRIRRREREFDADFLAGPSLMEQKLKKNDNFTVQFAMPNDKNTGSTMLPFGDYQMVGEACGAAESHHVTVDARKDIIFKELQCR